MRTVHMHAPRCSPAFLVLAASAVALSTAAHAQVRPVVPGPLNPDTRPTAIDHNAAEIPFADHVPGDPSPDIPEWVIEPMGAWGGPVHAFERHGDIGYVGSGQRLVVLDMSDLTDIKELGTVKLGSTVMDFKVRDGLAYVATIRVAGGSREEMGIRHSGFHVVDVSDIHAPEIIWSDTANRRFTEVDLWGDIAFVRERDGTMWAADLTDPRAPVLRGGSSGGGVRFLNSSGSAMKLNDLEIHGDLAYMAVQESLHQFQIFDLSTITPGVWPATPQRVGTANFFINRTARKVAVEGDWAYVLGRDNFVLPGIQDEAPGEIIWAVNVSNPAAPVKHGSFAGFSDVTANGQAKPVYDIAVSGGRLYAIDGADIPFLHAWDRDFGLGILDVASDPGQPMLVGTHKTRASPRGVTADEAAVYLFDLGEGLMVMDATDPASVAKIGGYHSPAVIVAMARDGDRMYLADAWNGLSVLDMADLSQPALLGVYQAPERIGLSITGVASDGEGFAYLSAGFAGMEVIDVSDPATPSLHGAIRLPAEDWRTDGPIVVDTLTDGSGKTAYLTIRIPGAGSHLFTIDVNNPSQPIQASPSPAPIWTPASFARYAPGLFITANGSTVLEHVNGVPASTPVVSALPLGSGRRFASVAYDKATETVSSTYGTQSTGTWFVTYDITDVADGSELALVPMSQLGDVAVHPKGAVVLGQWANGEPNRVTLMGLQNPAHPKALASVPLAFQTASVAPASILRASVLTGDNAIFVANHASNVGETDDLAGLETFRIRRTADRNADGVVDARDLWIFLDEVRRGAASADLNGDGVIDSIDIEVFLRWLTAPESR